MKEIYLLPKEEREIYFRTAADTIKMPFNIIEKDYWVVWILERLFALNNLKNHLTFKGGTSLSKVYKIDEKILLAFIENLADTMQSSFEIANSVSRNELGEYCFQHPGFFYFLRIIDKILGRFAKGDISIQEIQERIEQINNKNSINILTFP